jgi:ATP-dependent helicase HrpA
MTNIGLGDVARFPFVEPPDTRSINDGVALLEELGALELDAPVDRRRLTPVGRQLAQLPLDPRLARMVLEADRNGCVSEVMVIAAALSIQDPARAADGQGAGGRGAPRPLHRPDVGLPVVPRPVGHIRQQQAGRSSSGFRRMCKQEHLSYLRVREWQDSTASSDRSCDPAHHPQRRAGRPDAIHRSLLSGLLSHIGMRDGERQELLGARNARFAIARARCCSARRPRGSWSASW